MKIIVDKDGKDIITQLCDIALKVGGLQNMPAVNVILASMESITEPVEAPTNAPEEGSC